MKVLGRTAQQKIDDEGRKSFRDVVMEASGGSRRNDSFETSSEYNFVRTYDNCCLLFGVLYKSLVRILFKMVTVVLAIFFF